MREFKHYLKQFADIRVGEAWAFISALNAMDEIVLIWNPHEHKYNRTNAGDLLNNCGDRDFCAKIGPVQFMGGPPGSFKWITGTLRTFVMDKILSHIAKEETLAIQYGPKVATSETPRQRIKVRC